MFNIDTVIDEIQTEMNLISSTMDKMVIDTLVKNYVLPSFNRDYPHVRTIVINDSTRFYPYTDLTDGDRFLNHIFLIKQDRGMYSQLQSEMGWGETDNFVTVVSNDVVKKIIRYSYKGSNFVTSPVILYDDFSNDYYYSLDANNSHVLIYTIMNSVDTTTIVNPADYEALKWYSSWKVSEFLVSGIDMSTMGIINQYLDKLIEALRTSDTTRLFNPSVSSLSFGGEISIGFTPTGTITQSVQSAIPIIQSGYKGVQDSIRKYGGSSFKKFKNLLMRKYMQLYLV